MRNQGFTLMEILLALTILMIGVSGILVLFPIGLAASKSAIQDSVCAIIAESVHSGLKVGMRGAIRDDSMPGWDFQFIHDGVRDNARVGLSQFGVADIELRDASGQQWFPNDLIKYPQLVWRLSSDNNDIQVSDRKDGLKQYSFRIMLERYASVNGLFSVRIYVYRNFDVSKTVSENNTGIGGNRKRARLLKIFYTQIGVQ